MRKIREVLRLHYECRCKHREIAASCRVSAATVQAYLRRAEEANFGWEQAAGLSDAEVESRLFKYVGRNEPADRAPINCDWVHRELQRRGVTLQLLWGEYQQSVNGTDKRPYQYSQFCDLYTKWRKKRRLSMRQVHRAGEKVFIDYSGVRPQLIDAQTGEVRNVELFVAVLGASNYTYAEATLTQSLPDFVASCIRTLEYFEAVPRVIVPDQLRSAVKGPDRYDPDINQTFLAFAQHYGMAVIPTPPRSPKAKAKVETGVLIAQRWILARLRNRRFFSLAELNNAIAELVEELNCRRFKKLEGTRLEAFTAVDRPAMKALPVTRFEVFETVTTRVNIDYCIEFDGRLYSVPNALRQEQVTVRATANVVEIWHLGSRVASHRRNYGRKGTALIVPEHRPQSHEDYGAWPPERMLGWAAKFGPHVEEVVRRTLGRYPSPEMGYRPVLGILRCAEKHGRERMDAACQRALASAGNSVPHRKHIEGILKHGLDRQPPVPPPRSSLAATVHENVRGGGYFDKEEHSEHRRNDTEAHQHETQHAGESSQGNARPASRQTTLF
jgi:transposase